MGEAAGTPHRSPLELIMAVSVGHEGALLCPSCDSPLEEWAAYLQRAKHSPGLLQPTHLADYMRLQKNGQPPRVRKGQCLVQSVPGFPS